MDYGYQWTPKRVERFWRKVRKTDTCWVWEATKTPGGYGQLGTIVGGRGGKHLLMPAHRAAWLMTYGDIPGGLQVNHRCDVRACVRPDHLFLGTQTDNIRDMWSKGRGWQWRGPGESNKAARLTAEQVLAIRAACANRRFGLTAALARQYGVSLATISNIVLGNTWKHLL